MIGECQHCTQYRHQLPTETQQKHKISITPWTKDATDIFYLNNMSYIIIIDHTTKFFDVQLLKNCKSITVIKKNETHFCNIWCAKNNNQ